MNFALYFKGYKSFPKDQFTEISNIKKVNILIGKNNSGKSSIIDVIEAAFNPEKWDEYVIDDSKIELSFGLTESIISPHFRKDTTSNSIVHFDYGMQYVNSKFRISLSRQKGVSSNGSIVSRISDIQEIPNDEILHNFWKQKWIDLGRSAYSLFKDFKVIRLNSERDILPEEEKELYLFNNGEGATNVVRIHLNEWRFNDKEKLITKELLSYLNEIMYPEALFEDIKIKSLPSPKQNVWEISLFESNIGLIPISKSGSGIKTILLVLLKLLVIPSLPEYSNKRIIFAFEEIENNLHPSLQRKLLNFIVNYTKKTEALLFFTTHSNISINMLSSDKEAQILHVERINQTSIIKQIDSQNDMLTVLDDLDFRASDILQSNGIIWVEGPSDRIYIKKWIDLLSENSLVENQHYQFLYYGGKLLFHYSVKKESSDLIQIMLINRNAAIFLDSDVKNDSDEINATKNRIKKEFTDNGMFNHITKGTEIENYIPVEAINSALKLNLTQCAKNQKFSKYIKDAYNNFESSKVLFAQQVSKYITLDNLDILGIKNIIQELIQFIKKWNKI